MDAVFVCRSTKQAGFQYRIGLEECGGIRRGKVKSWLPIHNIDSRMVRHKPLVQSGAQNTTYSVIKKPGWLTGAVSGQYFYIVRHDV